MVVELGTPHAANPPDSARSFGRRQIGAVRMFLLVCAGCLLGQFPLNRVTILPDYCDPISYPPSKFVFLVLGCHRLPSGLRPYYGAAAGDRTGYSCRPRSKKSSFFDSGDHTSLAGHRERRPTPDRLPSQRIPITFFEPADTTVHVHSVPSVEDARHRTANGIECRLLYQVFAGTAAEVGCVSRLFT